MNPINHNREISYSNDQIESTREEKKSESGNFGTELEQLEERTEDLLSQNPGSGTNSADYLEYVCQSVQSEMASSPSLETFKTSLESFQQNEGKGLEVWDNYIDGSLQQLENPSEMSRKEANEWLMHFLADMEAKHAELGTSDPASAREYKNALLQLIITGEGVGKKLHALNPELLQIEGISRNALGWAGEWILTGIEGYSCQIRGNQIGQLKKNLESLETLLHAVQDPDQRKIIEEKIPELEEKIALLTIENVKKIEVFTSFVTTHFLSFSHELIRHESEASWAGIDHSFLGEIEAWHFLMEGVSGVGKVGIDMYAAYKISKTMKFYRERLNDLSSAIEKCNDPVEKDKLVNEYNRVKEIWENFKLKQKKAGITITEELSQKLLLIPNKVSAYLEKSNLVHEFASVAGDLASLAADLSLVGAALRLAHSSYYIFSNSRELSELNNKIEDLSQTKKEITEDQVVLSYLLEGKIDCLTQHRFVCQKDLTTKILRSAIATAAITYAVKAVLVSAGVTIGSTAMTMLSATGIGAMVMGGGLAAAAVGSTAYQRRYDLEYLGRSTRDTALQGLESIDRYRQKASRKRVSEKALSLQEKIHQTAALLKGAVLTVERALPYFEKGEIPVEQFHLLSERKQVWQKELNKLLFKLNNENQTVVSLSQNILRSKNRTERLSRKKLEAKQEKDLKNLAGRFRKLDLHTIQIMGNILKDLMQDPQNKEMIKDFLTQQEFHLSDNELNYEAVIQYMTSSQ